MKEKWPLKLKTWNFNSLSDRIITFWYYQDSGRLIADKVLNTGLLEIHELDAQGYGQERIVPQPTKEVAVRYIGFLFANFSLK